MTHRFIQFWDEDEFSDTAIETCDNRWLAGLHARPLDKNLDQSLLELIGHAYIQAGEFEGAVQPGLDQTALEWMIASERPVSLREAIRGDAHGAVLTLIPRTHQGHRWLEFRLKDSGEHTIEVAVVDMNDQLPEVALTWEELQWMLSDIHPSPNLRTLWTAVIESSWDGLNKHAEQARTALLPPNVGAW